MKRVDPKHYTKEYYLTDATGHEEYKKDYGKTLEPRLERIVKEIPLRKGMSVLDIGCGRGEIALWCAGNGASKVVGIDYSKNAVDLAKKALRHSSKKIQKKVIFKLEDAKKMKLNDKSFDLVIMTEVLEHVYPEEQEIIFQKTQKLLKDDGTLFFHTAPSKWFNDYTYKYWCYPISTILVGINNLITQKDYGNLAKPSDVRTDSHKIMHVNEPDYFSLKKVTRKCGFKGNIKTTNVTVAKPNLSWKDELFNLLVYLIPISSNFPFNVIWGNDFYAVMKKDT
jgi:2-polyprenyl-3-methyl-5-hydroxy-6-metoxy-1,4-benzoquinol methylase